MKRRIKYKDLIGILVILLVLPSGCFDNDPLSEYQDEHIKVTVYEEKEG